MVRLARSQHGIRAGEAMFGFSKRNYGEAFEKQCDAWAKTRARGKQRFILLHGVLGWGSFMFVFMNVVDLFIHHGIDYWWLPISFVFWLAGGYGVGISMWNSFEAKFGQSSGH
jgi:hypothetical protein